jgi:hypothetical protein
LDKAAIFLDEIFFGDFLDEKAIREILKNFWKKWRFVKSSKNYLQRIFGRNGDFLGRIFFGDFLDEFLDKMAIREIRHLDVALGGRHEGVVDAALGLVDGHALF